MSFTETSMMRVSGWAWLFWAAVATHAELTVYKKLGDTVVLKLDTTSDPGTISDILWKHGPDLAAQLEGGEPEIFPHFKGRGSVNISSGEMTITGLTRGDSGVYTVEINNALANTIKLAVIAPVPTPTVMQSCDNNTSCVLTCDGNTADAEPVTYRWSPDYPESSRERRITKEDSEDQPEFSCELENPVSRMRSQSIANPFTTVPDDPALGGLKISAGLTVFISLLVPVVLLGLIHRWKAGMWFYQKDSMPWEADFWRRNESPPRDAAESNGIAARQEQTQSDEESPMTK